MREPTHAWTEESFASAVKCLPDEGSRADDRSPMAQRRDDMRELRRQEREEAKQRTRQALLVAGFDAFVEVGLDASVADICGRAGYSRGAFYANFRDRQDFVVAITEWMVGAMIDSFIADETTPNGLAETTERFAQALTMTEWPMMSRMPLAAVRLLDAFGRWPDLRNTFARFTSLSIDKIRKGVEAGQATGSVRPDLDPQAVGTMFVMASLGAVLIGNVGLPIDFQRQAETLLRFISPASAAAVKAKKTASRAG